MGTKAAPRRLWASYGACPDLWDRFELAQSERTAAEARAEIRHWHVIVGSPAEKEVSH